MKMIFEPQEMLSIIDRSLGKLSTLTEIDPQNILRSHVRYSEISLKYL